MTVVQAGLPGADQLPCALATVTTEGVLLAVNPALGALLGRDAAACCGGPFDVLLSTAGAVIYQSYLMPLLRLHGHLQEFSISLRRQDGQPLEVLLYASSRHIGTQRVHDLVMVPIRQRRRVEEEMLRVKRAADEAPGMIFQLMCLPDGSGQFPYVRSARRCACCTAARPRRPGPRPTWCSARCWTTTVRRCCARAMPPLRPRPPGAPAHACAVPMATPPGMSSAPRRGGWPMA